MKKRTLCLLLAGVMALSLLSGCGGQSADGQPNMPDNSPDDPAAWDDNVPNNEAPMVPPDDWEDSAQPEDGTPFLRDPRWDELQPGETAVQFYDIFIKTGMTVGEVVEAVESSKVYRERDISWGVPSNYQELDKELTVEAPVPILARTSNGEEKVAEQGYSTNSAPISISCDGKGVMNAWFFISLPGEAGTTYRVRDLPVFLVSVGHVKESDNFDETLTFMGSVSDIRNMGQQELADLMETAFQSRGPDIKLNLKRLAYNPNPSFPFSWNGYSVWSGQDGEDPVKGFFTYSSFMIQRSKDQMEESWVLDGFVSPYYCWWAADDAG